jgi:hypothetical protein
MQNQAHEGLIQIHVARENENAQKMQMLISREDAKTRRDAVCCFYCRLRASGIVADSPEQDCFCDVRGLGADSPPGRHRHF